MNKRMSRYDSIKSYITKDGSEIRELIHPDHHGNKMLSVAEATLQAGSTTASHCHKASEEIYVVMSGKGVMRRDHEIIPVEKGLSVVIMPGQMHCLENNGTEDLVVLCCCAPPYKHEDTDLA